MDATLTDRSPARWTARPGIVFLLETVILSIVMATPYLLLEFGWGAVVIALVVLGYSIWGPVKSVLNSRGMPRVPARETFLIAAFETGVPLTGAVLTLAGIGGWFVLAYRVEELPVSAMPVILSLILISVLVPVLMLACALAFSKGASVRDLLAAIANKGLAPFRASWLQGAAMIIAIVCAGAFFAGIWPMHTLLEAMNRGEHTPIWEVALVFPFLPLALVTVAAMLSIYRLGGFSNHKTFQSYMEESGDSEAPAARTGVFGGFAVACGWVVVLYSTLYPIHLGLVTGLSSITGLSATTGMVDAIEDWAEARSEEGLSDAEMAVILNEYGRWSPDSPEAGIPELFPQLSDSLPAGNDTNISACTMTLAAGVADPAAVRGHEWQSTYQSASDLKYCLRTACPSPVAWNAPDTILLASSHGSRNEGWAAHLFLDVFAKGRAPAPGGYCTADGELADEFQG